MAIYVVSILILSPMLVHIYIYRVLFIYLVAAINPLVDLTLATQSHQAIEHGLQ